jgi:hypothetical protein
LIVAVPFNANLMPGSGASRRCHLRWLPAAYGAKTLPWSSRLGFYHGIIDGRFGQASRDAIHDFQISAGIFPADGIARPDLLRRMSEEAERWTSQ